MKGHPVRWKDILKESLVFLVVSSRVKVCFVYNKWQVNNKKMSSMSEPTDHHQYNQGIAISGVQLHAGYAAGELGP